MRDKIKYGSILVKKDILTDFKKAVEWNSNGDGSVKGTIENFMKEYINKTIIKVTNLIKDEQNRRDIQRNDGE